VSNQPCGTLVDGLLYGGEGFEPILTLTTTSSRTAYEKGFKVFTLKDCVAATSIAAQDATLEYNFGMFSVPTTSSDIIAAIERPVAIA
jgi:Isochorismatase family